ncbi:MAG: DNA helicase [Pseudomonadota bacterium]
MPLSVPLYRLKRQARLLSRKLRVPLHQALDQIAVREGFRRWSLLVRHCARTQPAAMILKRLAPGNMLLLGARPGQGKTMLSVELCLAAMRQGRKTSFFSLEYSEANIASLFSELGESFEDYRDHFCFDGSDAICADHIVERVADVDPGTLIVIDYLQLLDQNRQHPTLMAQVQRLKSFTDARQLNLVALSQIHRHFDPRTNPLPTLDDVRLPNPLDLRLFDQACFLHDGQVTLSAVN